jgi:murein DD-endopeptidase MepM/ murein hydrolase activator NlpD
MTPPILSAVQDRRPAARPPGHAVWLLGLAALAGPALACGFAPDDLSMAAVTGSNVVWNCPTATPPHSASPEPTTCVAASATPGCAGCTPGPSALLCTDPAPTAIPLPSATPYGRWLSPGERGTDATFYQGQDVRVGPLRITLRAYTRSAPIPGTPGNIAHIFTLATANEGAAPLSIQWPLQTMVREVAQAGTSTAGLWQQTWRAERAAGIPRWDPAQGAYAPGQARTVTVAVEGPPGVAHALGFLPDPVGGPAREGLGQAAHIVWFLPQADAYCRDNTSGPPRRGDGGATYPQPLPAPPAVPFGYFAGWPLAANGPAVLSQPFGCTAFHEISGFACPNDRPWFHSGIDLADPSRPLVFSVLHGRVIYVGPSAGRACTFPGAEDPKTNLGWMIEIQALDAAGHAGPYRVKYGHLKVGSEQAQIGDEVEPGQPLARMASTGCSTGPHLHFMVQDETGQFLDPFNFIGPARK